MKLTKRILCLLMAMALTVALCACGADKSDDQQKDNGTTTTTTTNAGGGALEGDNAFNDGVFGAW